MLSAPPPLARTYPGMVNFLVGKVTVVGSVPPGPVLICSNHTSFRDVFIYRAIHQGTRLLVHPLVMSFPFLQRFALKWGFVQVTIPDAVALLRQGEPVAICPTGLVEGLGEDLLPFKTGAVRIALEAGVPLVPLYIRYATYPGPWINRFSITTQNIFLLLLWPFYRSGATVVIGEAYRPSGEDVKALTGELKGRVVALRPLN